MLLRILPCKDTLVDTSLPARMDRSCFVLGVHARVCVSPQDPPLPLPVLGLLFESFMSRFVSRWFVDDEIEALLVSYRVFRVLLFYVDPGLANKLDEADFVPELYATAWLITLFSRWVVVGI